ncbi:MAG: NfeD family protein, partial [Pseudomonadota bacterium]
YFLLWLSLASVTVAGLLWAMPDLSGLSQLATWAVSAIGYTVVGWKVFGKRRENEPLSALNNRAAALIGRHAVISDAFRSGSGPVEVDGILWRGRLADPSAAPEPGAELLVTDADGMTLILANQVEPTL